MKENTMTGEQLTVCPVCEDRFFLPISGESWCRRGHHYSESMRQQVQADFDLSEGFTYDK